MKVREIRRAEKYFDETGMPMVRTTSGHLIPWNRKFITNSLIKETKLAKEFHNIKSISKEDAEKIAIEGENKIKEMKLKFVSGPLVREIVNTILLEKSAKRPEYVIYRNLLTRVGIPVYDAYEIDKGEGFEARENANLQPNSETVHKKKADKMSKEQYLLLMPTDVADAHLSGDLHIHDLDYFGTRPFCQDWDLRYFLYYGFLPDGLGTRTSVAGPAKHAEVAVLHSTKILAAAQTNFAGGEGFYNYLVFLAPFVRGLEFKRVKQLMQLMFFELTQMYVARGGQPVFSNLQITPGVPDIWKNVPIVAKGQVGPDVYGNYEDEVRTLYRAINEVAMEGDYWGKPFHFPKLENGISYEFFKKEYDDEWLLAHKLVAKFGIPYFDNMLPEYRGYGKGVSCYQCCAYSFTDTPETDPDFHAKLNFDDGKHFSMGSWQVVTLNLPRAAYRAGGDDSRLIDELKRLMDFSIIAFKSKKHWMDLMLKNNRIPFAQQGPKDPRTGKKGPPPVDFNELVWVIGLTGANEMVQHHTGYQLHESDEAVKLTVRAVLEMRKYLKELESKHKMKLSLARAPAESCAQRLAICDMLSPDFRRYAEEVVKGDLKAAKHAFNNGGGGDVPIYYTNGTHVYVGAQTPLLDRMKVEGRFFPALGGGNMFHVWLGENNPDVESLFEFTKKIATQSQIGYYAYTKDLTICENCNAVTGGVNKKCPSCNSSKVKWWSRVTGYYQEVSSWNQAKQREWEDRFRVKI
jgi:ribonucleoside-triphosphate reductase